MMHQEIVWVGREQPEGHVCLFLFDAFFKLRILITVLKKPLMQTKPKAKRIARKVKKWKKKKKKKEYDKEK